MPPCDGSPYDICEDLEGDLNGDGIMDVMDFLTLLSDFGTAAGSSECPCPCLSDLDGNGQVSTGDLLQFLAVSYRLLEQL